ncbi:TolC family protein [Phenylobacterium soli]|uniref:Transporter n=1 Tax=Phenylobacterium soli TaxID=2170551 RepID=A0A328AKA2_9CAUL|nr:TolC family protein [Phenylobacterium soli]RAK54947.1 transporter [Phenylobacterium soli]
MIAHSRRCPLLAAASAAVILGALASGRSAAADPAPPFTELLAQARDRAPRLAEAESSVRQAEGLARQAGARPNPEASVEVENFDPRGRGADQIQTTLSLGQPIELGGKRPARIAAGRAAVDAAQAKLTQSRADYAYDLAGAYAEAEVADRRVKLAMDALGLAQEDLRAARALVEAGKEAELRSLQGQATVTQAKAELSSAEADRAGAFARLSALAGSSAPFTSLSESLLSRPSRQRLQTNIDPLSVPSVVAAQAEREAVARRVRVEKTKAIPDVTASLGVRRFNGDGSTALVAGVSVPIPIFDQNRGNISAAQAELAGAEARLASARLDAEADLRTALFNVDAARTREAAAAEGEQTASEAYRLTRIAYESGKSSLIELNTARRALADARTQTLEAQLARVRAEAALARLQGRAPFGAAP